MEGGEVEQANKESTSFYLIAEIDFFFNLVEKFWGKQICCKDTDKSNGKPSWSKQQTEHGF